MPTMTEPRRARSARFGTLAEAAGLSALWLLFSGHLDPLHLGYGALSVAIVVSLSRHLLSPQRSAEADVLHRIRLRAALAYPFWFVFEVIKANLHVAWTILLGRRRVDPVLLEFDFPVDCNVTKVTLGNSITLTPGTLTLRIDGDRFVVHALDCKTAAGLVDGAMQRKAAALFGHDLDAPIPVEVRRHLEPRDQS